MLATLSLMVSTSSATFTTLKFDLKVDKVQEENLSQVHFRAGGNDFGGVIARSQAEEEHQTIGVSGSAETLDCTRRIRGLYYNSQRGERLWPLDGLTATALGYTGLDMYGGLFTSCGSGESEGSYGIYGRLTHNFNKQEYYLSAGVKYGDVNQNAIQPHSPLAPTLERFNQQYPLGLIYDDNGGIGLVGCQFTSGRVKEDLATTLYLGISNIISGINEL
jgi:hypothetical protein